MYFYFLYPWTWKCYGLLKFVFIQEKETLNDSALIAKFMGPTWGPSGADWTQMGPMLAPWILLSGYADDLLKLQVIIRPAIDQRCKLSLNSINKQDVNLIITGPADVLDP